MSDLSRDEKTFEVEKRRRGLKGDNQRKLRKMQNPLHCAFFMSQFWWKFLGTCNPAMSLSTPLVFELTTGRMGDAAAREASRAKAMVQRILLWDWGSAGWWL